MKKYLAAVISALVAGYTVDAHAFLILNCNGVNMKWTSDINIKRNLPSIPTGSARESGLFNAILKWGSVPGMAGKLFYVGDTFDNFIDIHDGTNEVAIMNRSRINGFGAITYLFPSIDSCDSDHYYEFDTVLADDLDFNTNPDETTVAMAGCGAGAQACLGRATFLHELGHALGFRHDDGYNVMRSLQPRPLMGGPGEHVDVLPDDANGGRFLYPLTGGGQNNVFASALFRDGATNQILQNASQNVVSCTGGGGTLTIRATVGNNGTTNVTQTERWFVSTNKTAYGGTQIGQWNNSTYNSGGAVTVFRTLTMPPLAAGTYFVFHAIDVFNVVGESREDDNVAREAFIITVVPC